MNQRDIARKLGVSQTTVSLVLKNPATEKVSKDKREAILSFSRENGYSPARADGRTGNIGHLIDNRIDLNNPFYQRFFCGIQQAAAAAGMNVIVENGAGADTRLLSPRKVDGLIIERDINEDQLHTLTTVLPGVLLNVPVNKMPCDTVTADNHGGVREAVKHLVCAGFKRVAFFVPRLDGVPPGLNERERIDGFHNACREFNLDVPEAYVRFPKIEAATTAATAEVIRATLLAWREMAAPPEAVVCCNDLYAVTMLHEAAALGVAVPKDLSVIGIDNSPAAEIAYPTLTSVDHNAEAMGRLAVELLLRRIDGFDGPCVRTQCGAELVLRNSVRT